MKKNRRKKFYLYDSIKERTGLICGICGKSLETEYMELLQYFEDLKLQVKLRKKRKKIDITIDHIIPLSIYKKENRLCNPWVVDNLQFAHDKCNNEKSDKILQVKH